MIKKNKNQIKLKNYIKLIKNNSKIARIFNKNLKFYVKVKFKIMKKINKTLNYQLLQKIQKYIQY